MQTAKATELARLSPHQRQVVLVRASVVRGVTYAATPLPPRR